MIYDLSYIMYHVSNTIYPVYHATFIMHHISYTNIKYIPLLCIINHIYPLLNFNGQNLFYNALFPSHEDHSALDFMHCPLNYQYIDLIKFIMTDCLRQIKVNSLILGVHFK